MFFYTQKEVSFYVNVCQILSLLLKQGVSLQSVFLSLKKKYSQKKYASYIDKTVSDLNRGVPFSKAFSCLVPTPYEISCSPPNLPVYIQHICQFVQQQHDMQSALFKELKYPIFLLLATFSSIGLFFAFLFPLFVSLNQDFSSWPPLILILLKCLQFKKSFFVLLGSFFIFFIVILSPYFLKKIKHFFLPYKIANQLWLLSALLASGVSFKQGLILIFEDNEIMFDSLNHHDDLLNLLCQRWSLSAFHKDLFEIGYRSGRLGHFLDLISIQIKQDKNQFILKMISYAQPVLLCLIGFLIFISLYLMFIPMLSIAQQIL